MPQPSKIDTMNEQDIHNFKTSKKSFGPAALLADDVVQLYLLHQQLIEPSFQMIAHRIAGALIHAVCYRHLILGATSLYRVHSSQTFHETRRALEAAGTAYAIMHDEEKLKIFLADDGGDEKARRKAKIAFKPENIFPWDAHPLFKHLDNLYRHGSQMAHTNLLTFTRHLAGRGKTNAQFIVQDIPKHELHILMPKSLFWMLMAHLSILLLLDLMFESIGCDMMKFRQDREVVHQRLIRFYASHHNSLKEFEQLTTQL